MRIVLLCLLLAGAFAQTPPPESLTALEQDVLKATADWQALAKGLETKVARLLPCDPRTKAAIDEVAKASQNRLTALSRYYQAAAALAENRAEGASRVLAAEDGRAADLTADKINGDQELADLQKSLEELAAGARAQPGLIPAQNTLLQTVEMTRQRTELAHSRMDRRAAVMDSLRALAEAYQAREKAVKEAGAAVETERTRWTAYYAARSQRSQTECALTKPAAPARGVRK